MTTNLEMKREIIDFSLKEGSGGFSPETPYKIIYRTFPQFADVRLHYHDSLEINLYQNIQGQIFINGREHPLEKHTLIILPPGTLHSYIIPAQKGEMVVLQISITHLNQYLNVNEILRAMDIMWEGLPFFSDRKEIPALCQKLLRKDTLCLSDFLIWTVELLQALEILSRQSPGSFSNPPALGWLRKTMILTEGEYHRKLSLEEVARTSGFDPSYFSRLFKKHTGLNYKDYLLNVRLGRAQELLAEGVSVSEAAELSGFQDVSYFIKVFRENKAVTPLLYQKSLKKGELSTSLML